MIVAVSRSAPPFPPPATRRWEVIGFMATLHALAILALLPPFPSAAALTTLVTLYWVTGCLGVTIGYHRLLAHRSFRVPLWLERLLAICGSLSCQHGPIDWVGLHRHHHRHSDTVSDHHNSARGFWWSHMGWMLRDVPAMADVPSLTRDLQQDPLLCWLNRRFLLLQLPLGGVLYLLGEALGVGGWALVLWGIPLRLVLVYHVTWLVNSATHTFGYRTFACNDRSTNCWWVALLSFGEGWHNNHHAFPHSARHGLRWFEFDFTWYHIRSLQFLGLATRVRLATSGNSLVHGPTGTGGAQ